MIDELATVQFTADNYSVFWDGELYQDNLRHDEAVELANRLNEEGLNNANA